MGMEPRQVNEARHGLEMRPGLGTGRNSGSAGWLFASPKSTVVEFSARTGHPLRAVTTSADESGHGAWCGALWTDLSGRHALAVCVRMVRIDKGRFTTVNLHFAEPIAAAFGDNYFAW